MKPWTSAFLGACAVPFCSAYAAAADDPTARLISPDVLQASVRMSGGVRHGGADNAVVRQSRLALSPDILLFERFELAPSFAMVRTVGALDETGGLPFQADLTAPWQPALGIRAGFRLYDESAFRLTLAAAFESPLGDGRVTVDGFETRGQLAETLDAWRTALSPVPQTDIAFRLLDDMLPGNPDMRYERYEGTLTVAGRLQLGILAPSLELGVLHGKQIMVINLPWQVRQLLAAEDVRIPKRVGAYVTLPYAMPALEANLGGGYAADISGLIIPTERFSFWQLQFGITMPLALP